MKTAYRKKFLKELAKVPLSYRSNIESFVFKELPKLKFIAESNKIERLKGCTNYYKTRFGDYRVGMKLDNDILIIERVLHRKDIYKYYP